MATQAQILANRSNARKSIGPRTPEGKAVVAQNAVKHGLSGCETVITGEDLGEFEFHRERMLEELDPTGEVESTLAERIVSLSWRLKRAERLQTAAFASLYARQKEFFCEKFEKDAAGDPVLGGAVVRDFAHSRVLDRLLMYERRIEQSLYRTMAELKRHRILQEVGPGQMWELRRALASEDDAEMGNHGRDARATETRPDGRASDDGRTPPPAAGTLHTFPFTLHDASCKTKPISPSADQGQALFDKELTGALSRNEARETEPIGGAERRDLSHHPCPDGYHDAEDTLKLRLGVAPSQAEAVLPRLLAQSDRSLRDFGLYSRLPAGTIKRFVPVCAGVGWSCEPTPPAAWDESWNRV